MHFRQEIGKWGENLACKYLEDNNYNLIERNFLCRQGEIDIIAKDNAKQELVFIEVKTRSNFKYGNPSEAVNKEKLKHIKQTVKYYIYRNSINNIAIRFDIIEVYIQEQNCKINHIKQIL